MKANNLHFDGPNLENADGEIHAFLALLSRDSPTLVPCFYCCKLHDVKTTPDESAAWSPQTARSCVRADLDLGVWNFLVAGLGFTLIQYAMKLHRSGRDCSPYLDALKRSTRKHFYRTNSIAYVTHEARIDPSEEVVIMRSQCWVLMPRSHIMNNSAINAATNYAEITLCSHHKMYDPDMRAKICCRMTHPDSHVLCGNCGRFLKCSSCETEIHLGFEE